MVTADVAQVVAPERRCFVADMIRQAREVPVEASHVHGSELVRILVVNNQHHPIWPGGPGGMEVDRLFTLVRELDSQFGYAWHYYYTSAV